MKKFDLHIHTKCSDGINSPEEIVRYAKSIGLDGISITDHDTVRGLKTAKRVAKEVKITLIPGVEITTPNGDILALNVDKVFDGAPLDIVDEIHSNNGVAILAHPFVGDLEGSLVNSMKALKKFDAIEIFNAFTPFEYNLRAMELANKLNIPGTAGSDAHFLEAVGSGFTISKNSDIISAIKSGKIKVGWV